MQQRAAGMRAWQGLRFAAYGVLWALALTSLETLSLPPPPADMAATQWLRSVAAVFLIWSPAGIVLALAVPQLERRFSGRGALWGALCLLQLAASCTLLLYAGVMSDIAPANQYGQSLNFNADALTLLSYNFWCMLFYGSPFVFACLVGLRRERNRTTLAEAELARSRALALLGDVQLRALQGRIDSALLLRTLGTVETRFGNDAAGADQLLDRLVAFLRAAMPAVRHQCTSLRAEIDVVDAYAKLLTALDHSGLHWQARIDLPARDIVFAPLLLPLLLEGLLAHLRGRQAQSAAPTLALDVRHDAQRVELRLCCDDVRGDWLGATPLQRLRLALGAQFGNDWHHELCPEPGVVLRLNFPRVDLPKPAPEACHEARRQVTHLA